MKPAYAIFLLLYFSLFQYGYAQKEVHVYVTKTGKKYHVETCRYLKYSKKEITLQTALTLDYEPCLVCSPPVLNDPPKSEKKKDTVPDLKYLPLTAGNQGISNHSRKDNITGWIVIAGIGICIFLVWLKKAS